MLIEREYLYMSKKKYFHEAYSTRIVICHNILLFFVCVCV